MRLIVLVSVGRPQRTIMEELNDESSFTKFLLIKEDLVVRKGKDLCLRKVKILALIVMKLDFIVW